MWRGRHNRLAPKEPNSSRGGGDKQRGEGKGPPKRRENEAVDEGESKRGEPRSKERPRLEPQKRQAGYPKGGQSEHRKREKKIGKCSPGGGGKRPKGGDEDSSPSLKEIHGGFLNGREQTEKKGSNQNPLKG